MNLFVIAMTVVSFLVLAAPPQAASSGAGSTKPQAGRSETPPPDWLETRTKATRFEAEGKNAEMLALYVQWVAEHPDFGEGHFELGHAHEAIARVMMMSGPDAQPTRQRHLEASALHMRRGLELTGPDAPFWMMRALIELHDHFGLNRPAEYERLVRESVVRYPAEPGAHAYFLALLASKGIPIKTAARAARAAIPKGPEARVDLAGALVAHVAVPSFRTPALAPTLLPEASRLIDEALTLRPGDAEALHLRAQIHDMQATASQLPPG